MLSFCLFVVFVRLKTSSVAIATILISIHGLWQVLKPQVRISARLQIFQSLFLLLKHTRPFFVLSRAVSLPFYSPFIAWSSHTIYKSINSAHKIAELRVATLQRCPFGEMSQIFQAEIRKSCHHNSHHARHTHARNPTTKLSLNL